MLTVGEGRVIPLYAGFQCVQRISGFCEASYLQEESSQTRRPAVGLCGPGGAFRNITPLLILPLSYLSYL